MGALYWMITVIPRGRAEAFLTHYLSQGKGVNLVCLGMGTASDAMMDSFGLESREKTVAFTVVTWESWRSLKRTLRTEMELDRPGGGITFLVPMSSVGGRKTLEFLSGQPYAGGEESQMKDTKYEMIIAVANQGYMEPVMTAARGAGAGGGTVLHAKGTGMEEAERFFGVSLAAEKEMVFIVTRSEQKNAIMQAITEQAGMHTKAKAIVFSLPVTSTAGLRALEDDPEAD
ncbi:MAG: P-II family nitrogen regulator [Oscillospiraceae bacterium]|nr:P-II family nitrogen regulator [Oscillospiraceae bacterium]